MSWHLLPYEQIGLQEVKKYRFEKIIKSIWKGLGAICHYHWLLRMKYKIGPRKTSKASIIYSKWTQIVPIIYLKKSLTLLFLMRRTKYSWKYNIGVKAWFNVNLFKQNLSKFIQDHLASNFQLYIANSILKNKARLSVVSSTFISQHL